MLQRYLEEIKKTPLLSMEEEYALWELEKNGDLDAHNRLMTSYQPLVFKIATSFKLPEDETMELIQEGMIGLLEAAESYDYTRKVSFSLFASYRIKGNMLDFLKKSNGGSVLYLESDTFNGCTLKELLASDSISPVEYAEQNMLNEKIAEAMERLPEKEQKVLSGMYLDDLPAQSVADTINVSLGHVYKLQKRGIRRVRGMLSKFMHEFNK